MSTKGPKRYTLDALRGFAAIAVVFYHVVGYGKFLDPDYLPDIFKYFASKDQGHFRVLILFVISGTVITLTNLKFDSSTIQSYLSRRLIRLYPIYFIGVVLGLLLSQTYYPVSTIVGNFIFLDVLFTDVILENGPIWTLHYEIVFYLLFIPVALWKINPVKVFLGSIAIGLVNFFFVAPLHAIPILTSYAFGFSFWSLGMVIGNYFARSYQLPDRYSDLVSYLFLILALPGLNILKQWIYDLSYRFLHKPIEFLYNGDINSWFKIAFIFSDFSYLPYCFLAVILFSGYRFKGQKIALRITQLLPLLYLIRAYTKPGQSDFPHLLFPAIFYGVSLAFLVLKFPFLEILSKKIINGLIWVGQLSYGIYIIHVPLLLAIHRVTVFTGSGLSFAGRLLIYLSITVAVAYVLERVMQPMVAAYLRRKTVNPQGV